MIKWTLLTLISLMLCFGCKNPDKNTEQAEQVVDISLPEATIYQPEGWSKNGLDTANMNMLLRKVDHIDYVFNNIPLSMNQDGKQAIFKEMELLSQKTIPGIPSGCHPIARKIYLGDGEILLEADLYFSDECFFQVFVKDDKPLYGNMLSEAGLYFYTNLIEQAQSSMPENIKGTLKIPKEIQKVK